MAIDFTFLRVARRVSPADMDSVAHTVQYVKPFFGKSLRDRPKTVGAVSKNSSRAVAGPELGDGLLYYYDRERAHG